MNQFICDGDLIYLRYEEWNKKNFRIYKKNNAFNNNNCDIFSNKI